jgi:hypothetical protein
MGKMRENVAKMDRIIWPIFEEYLLREKGEMLNK